MEGLATDKEVLEGELQAAEQETAALQAAVAALQAELLASPTAEACLLDERGGRQP